MGALSAEVLARDCPTFVRAACASLWTHFGAQIKSVPQLFEHRDNLFVPETVPDRFALSYNSQSFRSTSFGEPRLGFPSSLNVGKGLSILVWVFVVLSVRRPTRQMSRARQRHHHTRPKRVGSIWLLGCGYKRCGGVIDSDQRGGVAPAASGIKSEMRSWDPTAREMCPCPVVSSASSMLPGPSRIFLPPSSSTSLSPLSVITN